MKNFQIPRFTSSFVVALCLLLLTQAALAWGPGGHMMVAHIAYQRLNSKAKAQVDKLIAIPIVPKDITSKSLDFVNASHWPDDLRPVEEFSFSLPLHFVDFPFTTDDSAIPPDLPDKKNILTALEHYIAVLKSNASDKKKAQALRFIIHFVGDIHQPLHCATLVTRDFDEGDHGGNSFMITLRDSAGRTKSVKLHSYWDGGIESFPKGGPPPAFTPPPLKTIKPAAIKVTTQFPASDEGWKTGTPFDFKQWAEESEDLAKSVVYFNIKPNQTPNTVYKQNALKTARKRVAWGGYRLAELLNAIWPDQ